CDHSDAARARRVEKMFEIIERSVLRQNRVIIRDVVTAVSQRRIVHRRQTDAIPTQPLDVVELFDQPAKIADAVRVRIAESTHIDFIEDRVLEPERIVIELSFHASPQKIPGYASLPARYRQVRNLLSISHSPRARWKRCVPRRFSFLQ